MILQNNSGENKVFIDENLNENNPEVIRSVPDEMGSIEILLDKDDITIHLVREDMIIIDIKKIIYDTYTDYITFISKTDYAVVTKWLNEDEIVSLSKDDGDSISVSVIKIPKFLMQENCDDKYPKFEVNLSDCIYSMKIYVNESEFIEIPDFQCDVTIHGTLDYISQLAFYLTEGRPGFFENLCNKNEFDLLIYNEERKAIGGGNLEYKLGEDGLYLTGGELENYHVEWNTFFKLIMDGKWEVDFE